MRFIDFIETDNIQLNVPFSSKKRLFEQLSMKLGENSKEVRMIYDSLVKREKIGATSLGNGVAIPHGRCLIDKTLRIQIMVLNKPANYESVDDAPVQLVVGILFPVEVTELHNTILKRMGAFFKKHRIFREIISAESAKDIKKIILKEAI